MTDGGEHKYPIYKKNFAALLYNLPSQDDPREYRPPCPDMRLCLFSRPEISVLYLVLLALSLSLSLSLSHFQSIRLCVCRRKKRLRFENNARSISSIAAHIFWSPRDLPLQKKRTVTLRVISSIVSV
jgi:hypothetical protein